MASPGVPGLMGGPRDRLLGAEFSTGRHIRQMAAPSAHPFLPHILLGYGAGGSRHPGTLLTSHQVPFYDSGEGHAHRAELEGQPAG
jgi:hypothetical protein